MPSKDKLTRGKPTQSALRTEAEAKLAHLPLNKEIPFPTEELFHELQVHQIELEMQNETLRQSQIALEESRDRFIDFYDFAPTGYITLNQNGLITEINLMGASLLENERGKLIKRRFDHFVSHEDKDRWHRFFISVLSDTNKLSCELKLLRAGGTSFYGQLECLRLDKLGASPQVRIVLTDISERRMLEAALLESEKRRHLIEQQEIVQTSLDGFWVVNSNTGQIIDINDTFCKMVGYTRAEILSMSIQDLDAIESPQETEARIKKIHEVGYDRFETQHRHKLGHLVDVEVSVTHSEVDGGKNFAFFRDITVRKQEEKFKQSILNSVTAEIAVLDRNGVIVAVNQPWRQFALENGIESDKTLPRIDVGSNYLTACQSSSTEFTDGAQEAIRGIRAVMDGQLKYFSYVYPCHSPQQQRWFRMIVTPLGENVNDGVVITHTDISERVRAEESIRQSRDQLRTFIAQASISIAMFDQNMNYLAVSDRWKKEYDNGCADLSGLNLYTVHPDIPDKWKIVHQQALAGATIENQEYLWIQPDGSQRWLRWAAHPWVDENKKIGGIILFAEDITGTKKLEMEMADRRDEMEQLQRHHVAAQTASAIAHEINQPLLAIASYSQAALMMIKSKEPDYEEICEAIEESETQALRAGKSIRDLINFLNRKEFPVDSLDFNQEIRNAIGTAKSEHNLVFHSVLNLEQGLPFVRANRTHVQKVLLNLIHNGIDAMEAAGVPLPAITVTVRTTKDGNFAQMTIHDNGPGVNKEDINRLFEPFFTTKSTGIGMGLAISRSLIEENGGQLWIDPQEGPGATFHLTLPFAL